MPSGRGIFVTNTADGADITGPETDFTYCIPSIGPNKNQLLVWDGTAFVPAITGGVKASVINVVIDGGGSAITPGIKLDLEIPFACTITGVTLLADVIGSIVIDIWKDSYASNYPPTVADTITASAKPTISAAVKSQDTTLTGWTTSISAGETLRFNVDSVTTITRVTLALKITKL